MGTTAGKTRGRQMRAKNTLGRKKVEQRLTGGQPGAWGGGCSGVPSVLEHLTCGFVLQEPTK